MHKTFTFGFVFTNKELSDAIAEAGAAYLSSRLDILLAAGDIFIEPTMTYEAQYEDDEGATDYSLVAVNAHHILMAWADQFGPSLGSEDTPKCWAMKRDIMVGCTLALALTMEEDPTDEFEKHAQDELNEHLAASAEHRMEGDR